MSLFFTQVTTAFSQLWEIADPDLPYIAMVRDNGRATGRFAVIYNPDICEEIGDACYFFRKHEWAHGWLNHSPLLPPDKYPTSTEAVADCWAARNVDPSAVLAAYELFLDTDKIGKLKIYGDPVQRAQKVRACAIEAGNWIGEE